MVTSNDITLIDGNNVSANEYEVSKTFNKHCINIAKKSSESKSNEIGSTPGSLSDSDVFDRIIDSNQKNPSVLKIKKKFVSDLNSFKFQQIKTPELKKLFKNIGVNKAVGVYAILPKLIKTGANIIPEPLTLAINCCLRQFIFPDNAKIASVKKAIKKT